MNREAFAKHNDATLEVEGRLENREAFAKHTDATLEVEGRPEKRVRSA